MRIEHLIILKLRGTSSASKKLIIIIKGILNMNFIMRILLIIFIV